MEDFYIGGAPVKLFLPIFKMNFPEIVGIALREHTRPRRIPHPIKMGEDTRKKMDALYSK